jgi:hypothetical protein
VIIGEYSLRLRLGEYSPNTEHVANTELLNNLEPNLRTRLMRPIFLIARGLRKCAEATNYIIQRMIQSREPRS